MRHIASWGGILGAFGGLIWAVLFLVEGTNPQFNLSYRLQNQPAVGLALVFGVALQAAGFYSLSAASTDSSGPRISAMVCAVGASVQSVALLAVSIFGLGAAWIFGILGELVITIALAGFAVTSLASKLPRLLTIIPFLMVPFYFIGWASDPGGLSGASIDLVNLSAAVYGLLWVPFGFAVWSYLRGLPAGYRNGVTAA
jgi:hypothetical protein